MEFTFRCISFLFIDGCLGMVKGAGVMYCSVVTGSLLKKIMITV